MKIIVWCCFCKAAKSINAYDKLKGLDPFYYHSCSKVNDKNKKRD